MESNTAKEFDHTQDLLQEINILHISDLHFGVRSSEYQKNIYRGQRQLFINKLITCLKEYENEIGCWRPNVVVVSGDLAFRGDLNEYHQFKEDFYEVI